eukprot:TRINITY_DN32051_c0_g1_i1.p1 TRINITY_DN32051_c0_g1~~TRINITY_DN32051_c0_g1_i1.p1  ORF type:complete len:612 (+),score=123.80 TRINITY_DN32051_c0_g1_i1:89-1837(+)
MAQAPLRPAGPRARIDGGALPAADCGGSGANPLQAITVSRGTPGSGPMQTPDDRADGDSLSPASGPVSRTSCDLVGEPIATCPGDEDRGALIYGADEGPPVSFREVLRPLWLVLFLPSLAALPAQVFHMSVIAVYVRELGGDDGLAGAVSASRAAGCMVGNFVSGEIHQAFGAGKGMALGAAVGAFGALGTAAPGRSSAGLLIPTQMIFGGGQAWWLVARTCYVKAVVATKHRGRVTAMLAGFFRVCSTISPLAAGHLAHHVSYRSVFIVQAVIGIVAAVLTLGLALCGPQQHRVAAAPPIRPPGGGGGGSSTLSALRLHWRRLLPGSVAALLLSLLRAVRDVAVPLRGHDLGMTIDRIGVIVSIGSLVDSVLGVFVAGVVMDHWGRKWAGGPAMLFLTIGTLLLPAVQGTWSYIAVSVVFGVGNGISGPLVQVMSQDFAPSGPQEAAAIGVMFGAANAGGVAGPALYGAITEGLGLGVACLTVGGLGAASLVFYLCCVPESLHSRLQGDGGEADSPADVLASAMASDDGSADEVPAANGGGAAAEERADLLGRGSPKLARSPPPGIRPPPLQPQRLRPHAD